MITSVKQSKEIIGNEIEQQKKGKMQSKYMNRWSTQVTKEYDTDTSLKKKKNVDSVGEGATFKYGQYDGKSSSNNKSI